jgi:hypothetical protein
MRTRFVQFTGSPEANEGTGVNSNYSTERSPTTALLFEATRTVLLPLVRLVGDLPTVEILSETRRQVGCSGQEH